jgi:hypothetical protein
VPRRNALIDHMLNVMHSAEVTTGSVPEPSGEKSEKAKGEGRTANKEAADKPAGDKQSGEKQTAGKEGSAKEPKDPPPSPNGKVIPVNATPNPSPSAAERAILERLQERRQELEKRARELDIREGLIADAEKRVESKLMQIKEGQQQLATAAQKKEETEAARFKSLVTMYETMKAARCSQDFRPARSERTVTGRLDDESALDVGSLGAHDARSGRATHRRARESREDFAEGPQRQPAEDRRPSDRAVTPAHGALSEPPHAALPDRAFLHETCFLPCAFAEKRGRRITQMKWRRGNV